VTQPDLSSLTVAEPMSPTPGTSGVAITPVFATTAPRPSRSPWRALIVLAGVVAVAGLGWVGWSKLIPAFRSSDDRLQQLPRMTVAKVDMSTHLSAAGRVDSSHNTVIACELERLEIRTQGGRSMSSGGASMILSVIDEGKMVKKGDILCTLDSSDYEELVRTQEIKTEQADAAYKTAKLNFEVAELSVYEYTKGLYKQQLESFEGLIALSKSDVERSEDRLKWTQKMLGKGYASVASKTKDERTKAQSEQDLMMTQLDLNNFLEYGNKMTLLELSSEVEKRRYEMIANQLRVTRNRDQLATYKRMVDLCTIRAPHDGFLIYASDPNRPSGSVLEAGQTVRQGQKLFFLPDLKKMEVTAYIHESIAFQIHEGMRARAKVEGFQNQSFEGVVTSVGPLPTNGGNWLSDEVKYFVGVVRLDQVPEGMKPGMTAEVEFDVNHRADVLAVASEAVAIEHGRNVCYVAGVDGLERRSVTLGRSNRDWLEVKTGLSEGDQVVLRPERLGVAETFVVHDAKDSNFDETPASEASSISTAGGPVTVE